MPVAAVVLDGNVCTANDVDVRVDAVTAPEESCTEGSTFAATIRLTMVADVSLRAAAERYDIGIFVGNRGGSPFGGADCTVSSLNPLEPPLDLLSGVGPYRNLDGDACGDILRDDLFVVHDVVVDSLLCQDTDGNGKVDVDIALTWKGPNQACTDPTDVEQLFPKQPSKCNLLDGLDLDIDVEPPPSMTVLKTATPSLLPAPGGVVSYGVSVANTSAATDPLVLSSLEDDLYGNLDGRGTCDLPVTLQPGEVFSCHFDETVSGVAGATVTDVVTATAVDDEDEPLTGNAQAEVTLVDPLDPIVGEIEVSLVASPTEVLEPGALVTMTLLVTNISSAHITLASLIDDVVGDLNGRGSCSVPQSLLPTPSSYLCQYQVLIVGTGGDTRTHTASASGTDEFGNPVSDSDPASVEILDRPATMSVQKAASPSTVVEPGGDVTFTVSVQNTSVDGALTLTSLVDNVYGDLDGQGTCALPQIIEVLGGVYECEFVAPVSGPGGTEATDTVTATAAVPDGEPLVEQAGATVTITNLLPAIGLIKIANPSTVTEPGGEVEFIVEITNFSLADTVELTSLTDSIVGSLDGVVFSNCDMPQTLPPAGGAYSCSFTASVAGVAGDIEVDTVTALGTGDELEPVIAFDSAEVTVLADSPPPVGSILVHKFVFPTQVPEPGGAVAWHVEVVNNSGVDVTLESLLDDLDGDLNGLGTCSVPQSLPTGGTPYLCSYPGSIAGNAGDVVTAIVTGAGIDANENEVTAQGGASVTITDQFSSLHVTKLASPNAVDEPGGAVDFTIVVTNTSPADDVTVLTLIDSVHGNLHGIGTCTVPQVLAVGASYECQFQALVEGAGGTTEEDTVVALGVDDDGEPVAAQGSASVEVLSTPLVISVHKRARPLVAAPGAEVTFEITVTNHSVAATARLTELVDDIYGNLDGQGTCTLPQSLIPAESYTCEFTGVVDGSSPAMQIDYVVARAVSESSPATAVAQASAIVVLIDTSVLEIPTLSAAAFAVLALLLAAVAIWKLGWATR